MGQELGAAAERELSQSSHAYFLKCKLMQVSMVVDRTLSFSSVALALQNIYFNRKTNRCFCIESGMGELSVH